MANRDKQIDNKYKLQISSEDSRKPDELYFNEDQAQEAMAEGMFAGPKRK